MRVAVFGMGYVGCVSLGCLARLGHELVGVDVNPAKVAMVNAGQATIVEAGIEGLIRNGQASGRIRATTDASAAVAWSEASIICVGTPNTASGHLNMQYVERVAEAIGHGLAGHGEYHLVLIRSTVLPGANRLIGEIIAATGGVRRGVDFDVVSNPEFLREGSAVHDFEHPPMTVLGTDSERAFEAGAELYGGINAPLRKTGIGAAEMIKMVNNSWHALKVTFANEIGVVCKSVGVDSHEVMNLFCEDTKLNLSSYYLKPGFAYGGSCLPKDLKALATISHDQYLETPLLTAVERSNGIHKQRLVSLVLDTGFRNVGILGFSFKAGTDDLRSSPIVEVAESLLGRGLSLHIYDKNVHLSNLLGANRDYISARIPHLADLISNDLDGVMRKSELVVVANKEKEFEGLLSRWPEKHIVDLVRLDELPNGRPGAYDGITW